MKYLNLTFAMVYIFMISSCGSSSDTTTQTNPHAEPHMEMHKEFIKEENQKVMNQQFLKEISGTYLGMLPCTDCNKITYRLQLNEDETYQARITYQGKNNTISKKGRYSITNKLIIELDDPLNGMNLLLPEKKGLLLLDRNGNQYTGALADQYYLLPVARSVEEPSKERRTMILQKKWKEGIDFFALGNEPFWSLDMDLQKSIHFKDLDGLEFIAPAVEPVKAMGADVERYRSVTDSGEIIVEIQKGTCYDNMSGEKFDYSVKVDLKKSGDHDYKTFRGCGNYIPDYRLHDIWAITEVNGIKINSSSFKNKAPMMEINLSQNHVSGNDGCNNFNGLVKTRNGKIIFGHLISTMRACIHNQNITSIISGNELDYKFENNLIFYKNGKKVMVLKHID